MLYVNVKVFILEAKFLVVDEKTKKEWKKFDKLIFAGNSAPLSD